jgi:hypothetical protein
MQTITHSNHEILLNKQKNSQKISDVSSNKSNKSLTKQ